MARAGAPANLPEDKLAALNHAIGAVLAAPEVVQKLEELGLDAQASSPEQLRAYVQEQLRVWTKVAREKNIRLE